MPGTTTMPRIEVDSETICAGVPDGISRARAACRAPCVSLFIAIALPPWSWSGVGNLERPLGVHQQQVGIPCAEPEGRLPRRRGVERPSEQPRLIAGHRRRTHE